MTTSVATASQTVRDAFQFEVFKGRLVGPDNAPTPLFGIFRDDTGEFVSDRGFSKQYCPHTTDDVCATVEAVESLFPSFDVRCHFDKGHHVEIKPDDGYRQSIFGTNDNVFPRLFIKAGYDGKSFIASVGYYRDLCRNLHIMRCVKGTSVNIRHSRNLRSRMDDLIHTLSALSNSWTTLVDRLVALQNVNVVLPDYLNAVYGDSKDGRGKTIQENRTRAILERILREREISGRPELDRTTFEVSAWEAFNAIQGYTQHDGTRRRESSRSDFGRVLTAMRSPIVQKAEQIAFAALAV